MPRLEGKKMFLFIAPKKAGQAKKSQQKMDRERREAEAAEAGRQIPVIEEAETELPVNGGLAENAKGFEALQKLREQTEGED